jgi:hypothetical protein
MLINYDSKVLTFGTPKFNTQINSDIRVQEFIFDQTINTNNMSIDENVGVFENVISPEMCKYIISAVDKVNMWKKAKTVGEANDQVSAERSPRQNEIFMISGFNGLEALDRFLNQVFTKCAQEYIRSYGLTMQGAGITRDEGYQILRYRTGGYYKPHIDYSSNIDSNNGQDTVRTLSGLIYLNEDYEGGEIEFTALSKKIKPTRGSVVFFPSIYTHSHTSCPIKSGTKYGIVTWWK